MLRIACDIDGELRGVLSMDEGRLRALTKLEPVGISITTVLPWTRKRVERFIERTYRRHYESVVTRHYPTLLSVHGRQGQVLAAVGLRSAGDEPLFLEHYLSQPIETAVSEATGSLIERRRIVEIGNLSSVGNGASIFLFVGLAAYLQQQGLSYAVVTSTAALRRSLETIGIQFTELAQADAAALPDRGASWGRYYTRDPRVIWGGIQPAFDRLEPYLPKSHNDDLKRLFARTHAPLAEECQ